MMDAGLHLRRDKHKHTLMESSVSYLGYKIDAQGLPKKIEVEKAQRQKNITKIIS